MAHGWLLGTKSKNVQTVMGAWLKDHPKAAVVSVFSSGPMWTKNPSSKLAFVWVAQGNDNLNIELVRQGCISPETQVLGPDEKPEVSREDYKAFIQKIIEAVRQAKEQKIGIWKESPK